MRQALVPTFLVALALASASPARAGDLTADEARTLAALADATKRIETNLRLAEEAAGPGGARPPESKARLARSRLADPAGLLPQVRAELAKLPGDHADVAALRGRVEAAEQRVAALTARLAGTSPAAPASSQSGAGTRLDPRQAKDLADAGFYVQEIEGLAAALEALAQEVEASPDRDAFPHGRLRGGIAAADKARQRAELVRPRLAGLPADGAGVSEATKRLGDAMAALAQAEARVRPTYDRVEALVDLARYPTLATDIRRLQDLAHRLAEPSNFLEQPRRAAVVVAEEPAAREEHARFRAAYRPLVVQQTQEGRQAEGASRFFEESHRAFLAAAAAAKAGLPRAIEDAVAATSALADQAVKEEKPAFFLGGIPQRLAQAEDLVALQVALDPTGATTSARRLEALRADLAARQASLRASIIATNEPPPDRYAGADREALAAAAVAAWKKAKPDAEVLGVRIPGAAWERDLRWRRGNSEWYLIDRSRLQAVVIVRHGAELAALQPVDLWRDHLQGDALTAAPVFDPKEEPAPGSLLPVTKVR